MTRSPTKQCCAAGPLSAERWSSATRAPLGVGSPARAERVATDAHAILEGVDPSPAGSTWSEIAPWYDEFLRSGSGPHETALATLMALVPDPVEGSVLDVACGQGLATRALADRGPQSVTGVDAAAEMIEIAIRQTPPTPPISWRGVWTMPSVSKRATEPRLTASCVSWL